MRKRVLSALQLLNKIEDWFLVILLAIMVLLAVGQILYRNVFGISLVWVDPLLRTMVLWVALAGAVIATRTDNHIRIDFFTRYISKRFCSSVNRLVYALSVFVCSLIAWHGFRFVRSEYEYGTIAFFDVPAWVTAIIIPVGFGLMAFRYLMLFIYPLVHEPPVQEHHIPESMRENGS